jgi:hypothetical protein
VLLAPPGPARYPATWDTNAATAARVRTIRVGLAGLAGLDVFVYFSNDGNANAVRDARALGR